MKQSHPHHHARSGDAEVYRSGPILLNQKSLDSPFFSVLSAESALYCYNRTIISQILTQKNSFLALSPFWEINTESH